VGLERGPLSLVRINEKVIERNIDGSSLENWDERPWGTAVLNTRHPSIHKIWHYNSPTGGGRSVDRVRLWTESHGVMNQNNYKIALWWDMTPYSSVSI
jgi:hypothetical protein